MSVLTEAQVKQALAGEDLSATTQFRVPAGTVVTPSAKAWLVDQRIDLVVGDRRETNLPQPGALSADLPRPPDDQARPPADEPVSALPAFTKPDHFDMADGTQVAEKPEHMTALVGNVLVEKDHPMIVFRGQLDTFEAQIIAAQLAFTKLGLSNGVADLSDLLENVRSVMRASVLGAPLEGDTVIGLTAEQLRAVSHHPRQTFGIPHFFTSAEDGEATVTLNLLRTKAREVELAAYTAYKQPGGPPQRADIIRLLNRLSSACYIMMFKAKTGVYK